VANGVYQNTVFGMAAKLPFKYTGAVILGTVSINDTKIREFLLLGRLNQGVTINQPTRCNSIPSLLLDVYERLNMFWASSYPSSGPQQQQEQPLVLLLEHGGSSAVGRSWAGRPTALLPPHSNGKTRGCYCSC